MIFSANVNVLKCLKNLKGTCSLGESKVTFDDLQTKGADLCSSKFPDNVETDNRQICL